MKKLSVLILVSFLAFATTGCGDDDEPKKEEEFPTVGVVWKLQTINKRINSDDQGYTASECEVRSTVEFKGDKTFIKNFYTDEGTDCVIYVQKGTWTENENREFNLNYTEGEKILDAQTVRITSAGLELTVSSSDITTGMIEVDNYIYKF